jgi:predicted lactoylglutathione lyase
MAPEWIHPPAETAIGYKKVVENRVSLVTLGVADVARARAFYEALGWSGMSPDGDVVFFQASGMVLVDAVIAEAAAAGATIGRPGAATFWGGYSGIFIDPDGHPWEVAHNPGWVLAGDGSVHLPT